MILKQGDNRRCCGYVPRDAETRVTSGGKGVCSFSIKAGDREVNGGKEAIWQRCTVWEGSPFYNIASSIRKGDTVAVDGIVHHGSYSKNEGGEQIVVSTEDLWCDWLEVKRPGEAKAPGRASGTTDGFTEVEEDELPFD